MFRTVIHVFQLCGNVVGITCSQVKTSNRKHEHHFLVPSTCVFACVENAEEVFILFLQDGV